MRRRRVGCYGLSLDSIVFKQDQFWGNRRSKFNRLI
jgi:hypothetical protein